QKTGNLAAAGTVRSTMRLENTEDQKDDKSPDKSAVKTATNGDRNKTDGARRSKSKGGAATDDPNAKQGTPTVATADQLLYEDSLHRATYTTDAHVVGE